MRRFPIAQAPHLSPPNSVRRIMLRVLAALIPGVAALVWQFGPGVLVQISLALATAFTAEALVLTLRKRPALPALLDGSAAVTAVLLAVSLPPLVPWWVAPVGVFSAIVFGKQLYGGLGDNPFNPAMVGYAVLLISFPRIMTAWLPPLELAGTRLNFADCVALIFQQQTALGFDGLSQATPLDTLKTQLGLQTHLDEIQSAGVFGGLSGKGWQWVNFCYLAGGLWMLRLGIIDWRIPCGFLGSLFLIGMFFFLYDPAFYPSPLFHLFSGAALLGAFFIATDPISASTTPRGRLLYGALIGILVYVIRSWGGYPDGVAFAVLLMNFAAPTIDHYTRPRVFGHGV
jgi:electron transport complex protein RnfD